MWSGKVGMGPLPEACAVIKTALPYLNFWIPFSSNFMSNQKARTFPYFASPQMSLSIQSTNGITVP